MAVLITIATGDPVWDALGSVSIGVVLILVAAGIGIEIKGLLIGQSIDPDAQQRMRVYLERQADVEKVYRMITMQLGTSVMVAVKAKIRAASPAELVAGINRTEAALRAEFPEIQWLFFEPDIKD
jgi:divalent metal cation (Fe/Co/Zn/Cd) transporter